MPFVVMKGHESYAIIWQINAHYEDLFYYIIFIKKNKYEMVI